MEQGAGLGGDNAEDPVRCDMTTILTTAITIAAACCPGCSWACSAG